MRFAPRCAATYLGFLFLLLLAGCATVAVVEPPPSLTDLPASARRPRLAVMDFEDRTLEAGQFRPQFGRGIIDMLTTSLVETRRYRVMARDKIAAVMAEGGFGNSGYVDPSTAPRVGHLLGTELIITGAITGFEPDASGVGLTIFGLPVNGSGRAEGKTAHVAMDFQVIDTTTGEIVAVAAVEGTATSAGAVGQIGGPLPAQLEGYKKTPMDAALRLMVTKAAWHIATKIPGEYFAEANAPSLGGHPKPASRGHLKTGQLE